MTTDATTVARTWVAALATAVLVALWSLLARMPYPARPASSEPPQASASTVATDQLTVALQRRERALRLRAASVRRRRAQAWAAYRRDVRERDARAAAATTMFVSSPGPVGSAASAPAPPPAPAVQTRSCS